MFFSFSSPKQIILSNFYSCKLSIKKPKVDAKDCDLTLLLSYLFKLPLGILEVNLSHSSKLITWLKWRMGPRLRLGKESDYPHTLLILG